MLCLKWRDSNSIFYILNKQIILHFLTTEYQAYLYFIFNYISIASKLFNNIFNDFFLNILFIKYTLYNYCTLLSVIWCVMEHWKAILTKTEGCGQYCFSVLHNTSYCTKWSAVIVLLHLTFPIFVCVPG